MQEQLNGLYNHGVDQPLVSIVILAYNKLEYTQLCISSILKFTSHINFELIAVNNGSSDGTKEYFDSLANVRVVHLQTNVGPSNGFNEGMKLARGKYTACVCNDFIFTPRWLDNLLCCIESNESIGFVSPGASNVSNYQSIIGSYTNIEEMLAFADQYNHSDPQKWEERVRLLPCVLLVRTSILKELGGYDARFYYGEFADDDISFRIRRSGYKIIYCRDTFTFHFGSVTTHEDHIQNNSLAVSRKIFIDKYGLDAWADAMFNDQLVRALVNLSSGSQARILGINTKCGGNPLQLKNYLRENGSDGIKITNYCLDQKYRMDLETVSDYVLDGQLSNLHKQLTGQEYNYIILEHDDNVFEQYPELLDQLSQLLDAQGQIALSLRTTRVDEELVNMTVGLLLNQGFQVNYLQFIKNALDGLDLMIVAKRGA
ncbi:glycosyltransferase family 2 protein [Alicyclobacillus dauci]|uniref:Glycosyltransferase family 2 protein n=1 Tax=Alicyclobacillus dauci TaxID=1475485 RepID=A0ABY6Z483_9BACL|nr:glycosyltransferase family 2 protein [Alicyclobacillus dauci]WAH37692.1 glycosyltransferase family 2 protein [Alicyclobacillus dauci]